MLDLYIGFYKSATGRNKNIWIGTEDGERPSERIEIKESEDVFDVIKQYVDREIGLDNIWDY